MYEEDYLDVGYAEENKKEYGDPGYAEENADEMDGDEWVDAKRAEGPDDSDDGEDDKGDNGNNGDNDYWKEDKNPWKWEVEKDKIMKFSEEIIRLTPEHEWLVFEKNVFLFLMLKFHLF